MNIVAIETEYKGYRFRSRLEARWAVFFDEAGIKWEYEIEGYKLSNGVMYLPDFYLPEFQLFVEVKRSINGEWDKISKDIEKWEDKCEQFRTDTGKAIFIVYGDPAEDIWGRLFAWASEDILPEYSKIDKYRGHARFVDLGERIKPEIVVLTQDEKKRRIWIDQSGKTNKKVTNPFMMVFDYWDCANILLSEPLYSIFDEKEANVEGTFDYLRKTARQARFEYGESGARREQQKRETRPQKQYKPENDIAGFWDYLCDKKNEEQVQKVMVRIKDILGNFRVLPCAQQIQLLDLYSEYGFKPTGKYELEETVRNAITNGIVKLPD